MMGGRHRKGHKKTRKMRGGVMYGPTEAIAPGAIAWGGVDTSAPYSSATGAKVADPFGTSPATNAKVTGGRRHRATKKKGGKRRLTKKRGSKRRTMRGGAWTPGNVNSAPAGASFVGGIPNFPHGGGTYGAYAGYATNVPAGNPHPMGADGVTKV